MERNAREPGGKHGLGGSPYLAQHLRPMARIVQPGFDAAYAGEEGSNGQRGGRGRGRHAGSKASRYDNARQLRLVPHSPLLVGAAAEKPKLTWPHCTADRKLRLCVDRTHENVSLPLGVETSWQRVAQVQRWPEWAAHILAVDLKPPGALAPQSAGAFRLRGGIRSTFRVTEFEPSSHWLWVGPFLWVAVRYDHRFEAVGSDRTRLTWIVSWTGRRRAPSGRIRSASR